MGELFCCGICYQWFIYLLSDICLVPKGALGENLLPSTLLLLNQAPVS